MFKNIQTIIKFQFKRIEKNQIVKTVTIMVFAITSRPHFLIVPVAYRVKKCLKILFHVDYEKQTRFVESTVDSR